MSLRPYQQECSDALWQNLDRPVVGVIPTGGGKSHVIADLCHRAIAHNGRVLIICPSKELIQQNAEKIQRAIMPIPVETYCAGLGRKRFGHITCGSIQSLYRAKELPQFDLIIVDEAHLIPHGAEGMYHSLFGRQESSSIAGLTATPYRMNGGLIYQGEDALFKDCVYEAKIGDLVEAGFLCRVRARATSDHADLAGVHTRGGEFIAGEMSDAFDDVQLTENAVADVLKNASARRSIIVFCCSVEHAGHVETAFRKAGETSVAVVTGDTPSLEREMCVKRFRAGVLRILVNCQVYTTGFDAPNVDCIVLLRATQSPGLYLQMVGRGLRIDAAKDDCLLLDYGENVERHGPLDTITTERVASGEGSAPVKTCPQCEAIIAAGFKACPECGFLFPEQEERKPNHGLAAGDLDPMTATRIEKREVWGVEYKLHRKPGRPDSVRVEYKVGTFDWVREWVCPEHPGYARQKAEKWFARRGVVPMPATSVEALDILPLAAVVPKSIHVKTGKYPEVVSYEW